MKLEVFSLCDAATNNHGKLNILGTFDLICAPHEPVPHATCSLAIRCRYSKFEEGNHSIKVTLTDDDGKNVVPPLGGDFEIFMAPDAVSYAQNLVFTLHSLRFPNFGDYSFNLFIDNKLIENIPLFIRQAPKEIPPIV